MSLGQGHATQGLGAGRTARGQEAGRPVTRVPAPRDPQAPVRSGAAVARAWLLAMPASAPRPLHRPQLPAVGAEPCSPRPSTRPVTGEGRAARCGSSGPGASPARRLSASGPGPGAVRQPGEGSSEPGPWWPSSRAEADGRPLLPSAPPTPGPRPRRSPGAGRPGHREPPSGACPACRASPPPRPGSGPSP